MYTRFGMNRIFWVSAQNAGAGGGGDRWICRQSAASLAAQQVSRTEVCRALSIPRRDGGPVEDHWILTGDSWVRFPGYHYFLVFYPHVGNFV